MFAYLSAALYQCAMMGVTSLSVIMSVFVNNLSRKKHSQLPGPLRSFLVHVATFTCFRLHYIQPPPREESHLMTKKQRHNFDRIANWTSPIRLHDYDDSITTKESIHFPLSSRHRLKFTDIKNNGGDMKNGDVDLLFSTLKNLLMCTNNWPNKIANLPPCEEDVRNKDQLPLASTSSSTEASQMANTATLKSNCSRISEAGGSQSEVPLNKQWLEAAMVIDRLLFVIFFLLSLGTTVGTLLIIPMFKPEHPSIHT